MVICYKKKAKILDCLDLESWAALCILPPHFLEILCMCQAKHVNNEAETKPHGILGPGCSKAG